MAAKPHRSLLTWLIVGILVALCGVLGFLQYRWIGEVSVAASARMRAGLQASLARLSQDFNSEITAAASPFLPSQPFDDEPACEREIQDRYRHSGSRRAPLLHHVALAAPRGQTVVLRVMNWQTGAFQDAPWPAAWQDARRRFASRVEAMLEARLEERPLPRPEPPGPGPDFGPRMPPPPPPKARPRPRPRPQPGPPAAVHLDAFSFDTPVFGLAEPGPPEGDFGGPGDPGPQIAWVIVQLDSQFVRQTWLPDLIRRNLEGAGSDYETTVVTTPDAQVLYESEPGQSQAIRGAGDASVALFDAQFDRFRRDAVGIEPPPARRKGPPAPDPQHWEMTVRHRAGSVEAAVARTQRANLAVTGGVLLLMLAAIGALIRFTRRSQRLAQLQMDFVAGVSHELRTPLTVIHTAAYNLQGRLAADPRQVGKYGVLIQKESGRLKSLVEQILRFASAEGGRLIEAPRPVSIESVVDRALETCREQIESSGCTVERHIAPDLPPVAGDPAALEQVVSNLVSNAIQYGKPDGAAPWIGISAEISRANAIELRVADHGPGIPPEEQAQVFDAFFRGARARDAQVHGTGLGLTLVKKIVDAHGGTISVNSHPGRGTEFIARFPLASAGSVAGTDGEAK